MSDPEPSTLAFSSSPPSTQTSESAAVSPNYAFLVHSQKTLTQNLPPRVDNKLLARQKRRRTSPEDHAILEAEYQRNPKPDKAARTNIVNRVSLGEKEVQIWFQNRRQNDRRKSKPLQPHELIAPRSDELKPLPSDDSMPAEPDSSSGLEQDTDNGHDQQPTVLSGADSFEPEALGDKEEHDPLGPSSQTSVATSEIPSSQLPASQPVEDVGEVRNPENVSYNESLQSSAKRKRSASDIYTIAAGTESTTPGTMLQNFKSPPSLRLSLSFDGEAMVRKEDELTPSPPHGRNALRISMSADGKAVIRANGEPSPSKNRISMFSVRKPRFPGLRRSNSAVVLGTPRGSLERERSFGRSRDPRNWESAFDTDARSAISTPTSSQSVPNSASGLFRSGGPRSLTRSLSAKHSSLFTPTSSDHLNTPISEAMREKRRKLSRTVSSLGRLETNRKVLGEKHVQTTKSKTLKGDEDGDSDKENWIPGTRVSQVRRRAASHHHPQRPALKESGSRDGRANKTLTSARSRLSQAAQRKTSGGSTKSLPGLGADVSAFIAGGGGASQEEDLDCIQGLLSLSQGAWR